MIESLRGMGYSAGTAIADIADNSIAAGATEIDIRVSSSEAGPSITLSDNGRGMSTSELRSAMTLGERSPLDYRDPNDLGRFGLGLKTASFSQCRILTVGSKRDGIISVLRWDLDFLAASLDGGWYLLEGPRPGSERLLDPLTRLETGTVVVLESLDRMLPNSGDMQELLDVTDQIERHLSMVFHRFLGRDRLSIAINGIPIKPWDPFLTTNSFTWHSQEVKFGGHKGSITAQSFVLPHRDKLSNDEYDSAGGPDGWTSQQGFYVYRNERLLVAGSWLGLGKGKGWTKDEPLRLARIRLDLQNSADAEWKIDIRKSTAQPPVPYRKFLTSLAEDTRERARKVFAHRGRPAGSLIKQPVAQAWQAHHMKEGVRYKIDVGHPAVDSVLAAATDYGPAFNRDLRNLLRIIEETVPVQRIWLDTAEEKETPLNQFACTPSKEIVEAAQILFNSMITRKGMSADLARASLLRTEPFNLFPELVATLKL